MNSIVERSRQALPPPISAFDGIVGTQPFPVKSKAAELVRRLITVGSAKLRARLRRMAWRETRRCARRDRVAWPQAAQRRAFPRLPTLW